MRCSSKVAYKNGEFREKVSSKTHTRTIGTTTTMLASKAPPAPPKTKQKQLFSTMRKKYHHSRRSASFSCCSDDAHHHSRQSRRTVVFTAVTAFTLSKTKTLNEDDKGAAWAYEDEKTVPAHQKEDMPPVKYKELSLIHISEPTRLRRSRMPSSA